MCILLQVCPGKLRPSFVKSRNKSGHVASRPWFLIYSFLIKGGESECLFFFLFTAGLVNLLQWTHFSFNNSEDFTTYGLLGVDYHWVRSVNNVGSFESHSKASFLQFASIYARATVIYIYPFTIQVASYQLMSDPCQLLSVIMSLSQIRRV